MPCAISLTFAWAVSGAELCASSHDPNCEFVVMSSTIPGSASTKSLKVPASGESSSNTKTTARAVSPRIRLVAQAPRPNRVWRCIRRTTGSSTRAMNSDRNSVMTASRM